MRFGIRFANIKNFIYIIIYIIKYTIKQMKKIYQILSL